MINIITDFGAVPDGVTDNYKAFQDAEDSLKETGGEIYVPAGVYIVSKPFYHWSEVTLIGQGAASVIKNINQGADVKPIDQFCILIGNFPPSAFGECIHYDLNPISEKDQKVRLKDTEYTANFKQGDVVLIDSADGYISEENELKPYAAFINRIAGIDGNTINLQDPISVPIDNAKIALPISANSKEYICYRPVIKNIAFQSFGDWTMRFGVYKGLFEGLFIRSTDIIPGNGLSHCVFKNISAEFSQKVVEMATYSHDSEIDNLVAIWWPEGVVDPAEKPLLKMGENVRDCVYNNIVIAAGTGENFHSFIRFDHAFNCTIQNSFFIGQKIKDAAIIASSNDPAGVISGNRVVNCRFVLKGAVNNVQVKAENGSKILNNDFSKNTFDSDAAEPVLNEGGFNNLTPEAIGPEPK